MVRPLSAMMKIYYLEVVTPDVEQLCAAYENSIGASFSTPNHALGGAKTTSLPDGHTLGVRKPMHEAEQPVTRPYYLVDDIVQAVSKAEQNGATVAVPPMDIPGYGQCAIVMFGTIESGFWQV